MTMQSAKKLSQDFQRIVSAPTVSRSKLLLQICGPDTPLQSAYERLVRQIKDNEHRRQRIGSVAGNYRITEILGVGGAGTVYRGERADRQHAAEVAIKVIERSGADPGLLISRARAERQILASLHHPYIARLLDAGELSEGSPYFVMELIDGDPIDKFCDAHSLTIDQRVELFERICEAVAYAHTNLIAHCDLKPSNVLVTKQFEPKLLDFGIARLAKSLPFFQPPVTRPNDWMLTPEFASPEQILGRSITTASDIYSLGVLLYLVLTGRSPYPAVGTSQLELERYVCIYDPPPPSNVFDASDTESASRDAIGESAERRRLEPKQLKTLLERGLDSIVMKALQKEPAHRYSTAVQLAEDLRRFRRGEQLSVSGSEFFQHSARSLRSAPARNDVTGHTDRPDYLLPADATSIANSLAARHGLSVADVVRMALATFDPEKTTVDEQLSSVLANAHEQVMVCLRNVDSQVERIETRSLTYQTGALKGEVLPKVESWASVNPHAVAALRSLIAPKAGQDEHS